MKALNDQDNKLLSKLAHDDQKEREHFFENPEMVTAHDKLRRARADTLLKKGLVRTVRDYLNAALLYQHGLTVSDYRKAQSLARTAIQKGGGKDAKWFYALTTDRLLTRQGKKQKYGTQLKILSEKDPKTGRMRRVMRMLPYDKRVSDKTRIEHGLPTLQKMLADEGKPMPEKQKRISFK